MQNIAIVTYDWLEDSILKQARQRARAEYAMANALALAKRARQEKKHARKQALKDDSPQWQPQFLAYPRQLIRSVDSFARESQELQGILFSDRYHIYHDSTGFIYNITLVRVHVEQNISERYVLKLCVTHDVPLYFATVLVHHHPHTFPPPKEILAPKGSDWTRAFGAFTSRFKSITGVEWDQRLSARCSDEGAFTYVRPKKGEPKGEMASDWDFCEQGSCS
ncbi:MAG: hypothetical protein Q9183_001884 [Haloplaca sp. 2 TL-2023]